jgi:hypothetical protein
MHVAEKRGRKRKSMILVPVYSAPVTIMKE